MDDVPDEIEGVADHRHMNSDEEFSAQFVESNVTKHLFNCDMCMAKIEYNDADAKKSSTCGTCSYYNVDFQVLFNHIKNSS